MTREVNFKSDFDFVLKLYDCRGKELLWPDYDWRALLWTTSRANAYEVSCINGKSTNCYNDGGRIHVVCDNHGLSAGVLCVEFVVIQPDDEYADGDRRTVVPEKLNITLTRTAARPSAFDVEMTLPVLNGGGSTVKEALTAAEIDAVIDALG